MAVVVVAVLLEGWARCLACWRGGQQQREERRGTALRHCRDSAGRRPYDIAGTRHASNAPSTDNSLLSVNAARARRTPDTIPSSAAVESASDLFGFGASYA